MTLHKPKIVPFSHFFMIESVSGAGTEDSHFLNAIQHIVDTVIPESLWMEMKFSTNLEALFFKLGSLLPIFKHSEINENSTSVSITTLFPGEYSYKAKQHVADSLMKGLLPGKLTEIAGGMSLTFKFIQHPLQKFFIAQEIISIRNREENQIIAHNLPELLVDIRQRLTCEFLRQAENFVHPIFMPRNEEDTIRNLIVLSNQIKDLPQVSIHFEKQNIHELTFTVIIAKLLKAKGAPLQKLLEKSPLRLDIDDIRVTGYLKQKYAKEAAILRISINKKTLFRPDNSVDILKARQKVVAKITHCIGEFRDFNGGMILKQEESLSHLRGELGPLSKGEEFMLENYFYSLKPGIMQTIYDTAVLKKHFELFSRVRKFDLKLQPFYFASTMVGKFFLCFFSAVDPSFKEEILKKIGNLHLSSRDLTTSSLEINKIWTMGCILKTETPESGERFRTALMNTLGAWSKNYKSH